MPQTKPLSATADFTPASDADRLFALSRDLLCVIGADGHLERVNPAFERTLGWTTADLLSRPMLEFVHPDDRQATHEELIASASGQSSAGEHRVLCRDGSHRWLSWHASAPDEHGRVYAVARDVTESRRVGAALRRSEALLRDSQEIASVGSWAWDLRNGRLTWSDQMYRICGLEQRVPLSVERYLELMHPEERTRATAVFADAIARRDAFTLDHRIVRPDGVVRQLHCRGRVVVDAGGAPAQLIGSSQDITERRQAVLRLEQSEQHYRSLFEHHPDAVFSFDLDGRFVSVNPACERISGFQPGEMIGGSFADLVVPEHLHIGLERFTAAVAGVAQSYELAIQHKSGRRVELSVANVPILAGDRVVGVFGIARDLTVQRTLESQLRQAQKMEAVGRLAGGVAHDFNNLLTVIQNYGTLIADELPESSPIRADLDEILKASTRAAELTRQLLAFGRKQVLQPRVLDANEQVASVAGMLRRVIGEDITLETELCAGAWPAFADPGQLEQVLMNLAVNARDAMPDGGTLRLRTANATVCGPTLARPGLAAGEYVTLVVEDTGYGIDPKVLPNIFEPFYTTKAPGAGTGLGLATVYGIVKQSGGYVYVDSAPGEGARFSVFLPRAAAPDIVASSTSARPELPRGTETILLVEDETAVRMVARRMLEALGYTVREAASAAEALRIVEAEEGRVDLVLSDVVMPEQSGRSLAEQLAARWPRLRVLYMSGYTDDEILRRGLAEPGSAFLEKPFTAERLSSAVRRVLDGREGDRKGSASGARAGA